MHIDVKEAELIAPFFTNLDKPVYGILIPSPELVGALCSRTSRASGDLREIFLREFILPFLAPVRASEDTDETWGERCAQASALEELIEFLQSRPLADVFANSRARQFYSTWLAQYGDDSIAEMGSMHLVYSSLSQVALKYLEDQRIGLSPIEKSTRYVNYGERVGGKYLYYTDSALEDMGPGVAKKYEKAMDGLFDTYRKLLPRLIAHLEQNFPEEKKTVVEKKAFDTLRGLLPMSALSQVAFAGNGRAFEYLVNRGARHPLGEIRWAASTANEELGRIAPSFFRRINDATKRELVEGYQQYLGERQKRMDSMARHAALAPRRGYPERGEGKATVTLVDYVPGGENRMIAGMLYASSTVPWNEVLDLVSRISDDDKRTIIAEYFKGRTQRYQKAGRALEHADVCFEVTMNNGAFRDLHRERMKTQQRQRFTVANGYDIPPEIAGTELEGPYCEAIEGVESVFEKIERQDADLAQYATTLAHRVQFVHRKNVRECFWEMELRTIPEGHPDYRHVVQEEYRQLKDLYPLLAEHMLVNLGEYDFARRGQEERIARKSKTLAEK